jgi:glutathione S-transferase
MIHLYYSPGTASMAPHMLLEEIGAPVELRLVDRANAAHKLPEYLRLNPNGLIPVLVDGDLVLYETAAICLHLADTHPQTQLAPPMQTAERAHFYKWLVWCTNTLQAMLLHYFYSERMVNAGDAAAAAQVRSHAEASVGAMLDRLDAQLASHGEAWLLGRTFSAVDPYALMLCRWTRNFARPARSLPHLAPYL